MKIPLQDSQKEGGGKMQGNKKILVVALLVLLLSVCFGTYAIYRESGSATGEIKAAAWSVKVDGTAIKTANYTFDASDITWTTQTGYNDTIAPGSTGYIEIPVDATGSEVDVILTAALGSTTLPNGMTATLANGNDLQTIAYSATEGAMLSVFRVKPEFVEGEMVSFSLEEVQTIYFPVMSDSNCLGNPNVAIDTAKQVMYVYSRNNRKEALNRHKAKLTTFKIPTLRDREGNVVREVRLSDADILSSFSSDFSMVNAQGACAKSGMLYIAQVYSDSLHKRGAVLHKFDMDTQKHTTLDLSSLGFKGEIEGCWDYKGNLMFSSSGKMLYLLHNYY